MAKGMNKVEKSLEQLEKEITCGICQEHYTEPKVLLPCCHYYCKQCILRLALRTGIDQPFNCPECRKETTLPEGNVDKLQTAFFINRLKEGLGKLQEGTHETRAEHTLEEKCSYHDKLLELYCFSCSQLICSHCGLKEHKEHKIEFSNEAAPNTKKKLQEKLAPLKEERESLSHAMEDIETTTEDVETQKISVARKIETRFKRLLKTLENHKQQLLAEAEREAERKIHNLSEQAEKLSIATAHTQSIIDYTEQCVNHCTDNEVMSMHAEISRTIEREVEEHGKRGNMKPVEEADLGVEINCEEALQQLCQTKAKITRLPIDPSKCTVLFEGDAMAEVNKTSRVIVTTKLSNNLPAPQRAVVSCSIKSVVDNSITPCRMEGLGDSRYHILYTPTSRGRHQLTVSVNGQQVAGSPFPVFVSPSPTLLGKPVKVWDTVERPSDITINSVGEVIVIENNDIKMFDKGGKRLRSIKQPEHGLALYSIAVDSENSFYVPDMCTSRIYKWSKKNSKGLVHKVKQVRGRGFRGIAVVGEEVMACVNGARGSIAVYNRELEHVREIVSKDMGELFRISSDSRGNLYCSDRDNARVRVLSNGGEFLRSIGFDRNGMNKLHNPYGLCVAGQYVYVTNVNYHNVSVFATECEYVTSFGGRGSKHGCFKYPRGICVDKDGFVYVCDYHNFKIQVF